MNRPSMIKTMEFTEGYYNFTVKYGESVPEVHITLGNARNITKAPPLPKIHLPRDCKVFFDHCFANCPRLKNITELRYWDTSNAVSFHGMFENCICLSNIEPISNWNTGKVMDMAHMFSSCRELYTRKESALNWDTGNVMKMSYMFYGTSLRLSCIEWIRTWNLSNVVDLYNMFGFTKTKGVIKLMNLPRTVSGQLIFSHKDAIPMRPIKGTHYWVAEGESDEMIRVNREHPELPPGINDWFDIPV